MKRADVIAGLTEIKDPDFLFAREYLSAAGIDVSASPEEARALLDRRATDGEVEAQFVLAKLSLSGLVGPADQALALKWCEQAAGRGYAPAIALLSAFHSEGWAGVPRDTEKAFALLKEAAAADYPHAMVLLGMAYLHGIGTKKDRDTGLSYLKQASELGHEAARSLLESSY